MDASKPPYHLYRDFEQPVIKILKEVNGLRSAQKEGAEDLSREIREKEDQLEGLKLEIAARLTPHQRVLQARHPLRPTATELVGHMCTDVMELHGDRGVRDDPAILTALGRLGAHRVMIVGHRKGAQGDVQGKIDCNFGMANPEGYRKAMLKMRLAERFGIPIVTLVDTPGAFPGLEAEERGQAWAIAENLQDMTGLRVPIVVAVIGEGGSGGALGIGIGDRVLMMENAYYSVITPEGCAAILWKTRDKAAEAAQQLRLTAPDLHRLGIVDDVIQEPTLGAHWGPARAATSLKQAIQRALNELVDVPTDVLLEARYNKFRRMGEHLFAV